MSPDYFETLRISLLEGRGFRESDTATTVPVAIINEGMAKRLWPKQDPIGRRFSYVSASGPATFVSVPSVLVTVALIACYLPARRATRVDPLVALQCE